MRFATFLPACQYLMADSLFTESEGSHTSNKPLDMTSSSRLPQVLDTCAGGVVCSSRARAQGAGGHPPQLLRRNESAGPVPG